MPASSSVAGSAGETYVEEPPNGPAELEYVQLSHPFLAEHLGADHLPRDLLVVHALGQVKDWQEVGALLDEVPSSDLSPLLALGALTA